MDKRAVAALDYIRDVLKGILGDNLVGIYVHGSLAFECFCWEKSDIDFIVVTYQEPTLDQKKTIIEDICLSKTDYPNKSIEFSILLFKDCQTFSYPTPYCLHYSIAHQKRYQQDLIGYCQAMHGVDPDLAAHITVIHAVGIVWYGLPIEQVFAPVPKADYLASIWGDVAQAEHEITQNPVYFVLNLCRVLAYAEADKVLSKQQGGAWALEHMPQYAALVQDALCCYAGEKMDISYANDTLSHFAHEMLLRIQKSAFPC